MRKAKLKVKILGNYNKNKNHYTYKNDLIICSRRGSIIQVNDDYVSVQTDVVGIDKVYVEIKNNKLTISNVFKDFIDNDINLEFFRFQSLKGYVPFPFTLFEHVIKTPPGMVTYFYMDENNKVKYYYEPSEDLKIFSKTMKFNRKNFRKEFSEILKNDAKDQKELISSFSGGFDSLFLTYTHRDKVNHILHFSEDNKININYYKKVFPDKNWIIINKNETFSEAERTNYFKNIDEPGCDSAGFAEYLMIKNLNEKIKPSPVMNGQSSDTLFSNGRKYYQEYISARLPFFLKNLSENSKSWLGLKINNYTQDTKRRFKKQYLANFEFSPKHKYELQLLCDLYANNIRNDSVHLLAALTMMLIYPSTVLEKVKTSARSFNTAYYMPFMSVNATRYALSISPRYKVGYKIGKKILLKDYKEISRIKFVSRDFRPEILKEKFIEGKLSEEEYRKYYIQSWVKYNIKNKNDTKGGSR